MISDQDAVEFFRKPPRIPIAVTDTQLPGMDRQLFRGMPVQLWKDTHLLGCARQMEVFNKYKVIPRYCFDCYKILVTPRNVVELFKLVMVFEKIALPLNNTRKLMVEEREFCSGAYKGYVYCRSLDEANEVCGIVRAAVAEDISPLVRVEVKRGCSEFEAAYPEYGETGLRTMQYDEDWQRHEDAVDNDLASRGITVDYPDVGADGRSAYTPKELLCLQYWLRYAATIGDTSYLKIIGTAMRRIPNLNRPRFTNTIPQTA